MRRLLVPGAGKAEHDQDDADMHDVPAIPTPRPHDETDQRRHHVRAGHLPSDHRPADELLSDRAHDERTERKTDARHPDAEPERIERTGRRQRARRRPQELVAQIRNGRFAPRQQRSDAGQQQQDQPDRDHPLVEEGRADRDPLSRDRLAQRRKHRREQDKERREQQDPVVDEERRFARHPRFKLVAGPQQRQVDRSRIRS